MVMAESDNHNTVSKWPWDWQKEKLTDSAIAEIVKNLAHYAYDAAFRKPEEVGMTDSLYGGFQIYCHVAKDYFQEAVKRNTISELSAIATDAFSVADQLLMWIENKIRRTNSGYFARYMPIDAPYSYTELRTRWDTVVRKFDMRIGSVQQVEKASQAPAKHWKIIAWAKELYGLAIERITKAYLDKYG